MSFFSYIFTRLYFFSDVFYVYGLKRFGHAATADDTDYDDDDDDCCR